MFFKMVAMTFNRLPFSQQKTWPETSSKVVNAPRPNDKCYGLCVPPVCNGSTMTLNAVSNGFPRTCNGLLMISNGFPNGCNGFQRLHFINKKQDQEHHQKLSMRRGQTTNVMAYAFNIFAMVPK